MKAEGERITKWLSELAAMVVEIIVASEDEVGKRPRLPPVTLLFVD